MFIAIHIVIDLFSSPNRRWNNGMKFCFLFHSIFRMGQKNQQCMPCKFHPGCLSQFQFVSSHRQQFGDEESVSHPKKIHDPAVRVRWGLAALGALLLFSLAVLQRPACGRAGQVRVQGRDRGRRGWRGAWRRRRWGGTGQGGGVVPLRGQAGSWLQGVGQMFRCWRSNGGVRLNSVSGDFLGLFESGGGRRVAAPQLVPLSEPQLGPLMPQNHSQKTMSRHRSLHNAESYSDVFIHSGNPVTLPALGFLCKNSKKIQSNMLSPSNKMAQHVACCSMKLKRRREPHLFLISSFMLNFKTLLPWQCFSFLRNAKQQHSSLSTLWSWNSQRDKRRFVNAGNMALLCLQEMMLCVTLWLSGCWTHANQRCIKYQNKKE